MYLSLLTLTLKIASFFFFFFLPLILILDKRDTGISLEVSRYISLPVK